MEVELGGEVSDDGGLSGGDGGVAVADAPAGDVTPSLGGDAGGAPVVTPGAPAQTQTQDEYAKVLEWSRQHGIDLSPKYKDGRSAFEGLLHAQKALAQRDSYADIGRRVADSYEEFEEYVRTKRQPQQPPQQGDGWELPEPLPQSVVQHLYRDENGQVVMAEDAPVEARRAFERQQQLEKQFARNFVSNPRAVFEKLEERFEQKFLQKVDQRWSEREQILTQRAAERSAVGEIAPWLWQYGPDGKPLRHFDPELGVEVNALTPKGLEYANEVRGLLQQGLPSTTAHQLALRLIGGPPAPTTPAPTNGTPGTPAPTKRQQRAPAPPSGDEPQSLFEIALAAGNVTPD